MSKPECMLIGEDGNAFNLMARVSLCLRHNGLRDQANEFEQKAYDCESYDALLVLIGKYVTIV